MSENGEPGSPGDEPGAPGQGDAGVPGGGDGRDAAPAGSGTDDAAPDGSPADPGELLGEVRAIRRRARVARHAYWFPLVLFGVLAAASVPFYVRRLPVGPGTYASGVTGPAFLQSGYLGGFGIFTSSSLAYYWLGAMLFGIAATVLWYRWRGNRVGLRTPSRGYLVTGLILVALALLLPVITRGNAAMPVIMPGDLVGRGTFPLVLIGLGLCVLAWAERSVALTVIACGYLGLSVAASLYDIENVLYRLHWNLGPAASSLPNVVLPALVLLLSGAGAWVVQRRHGSPPRPAEAAGGPAS